MEGDTEEHFGKVCVERDSKFAAFSKSFVGGVPSTVALPGVSQDGNPEDMEQMETEFV